MTGLSEHDVFLFVAQLGVIILGAHICGLLAKTIKQPVIVGEVLAGIILGPMVFGRIFPAGHEALFPEQGPTQILLQGMSWLCVLFLLLITGLEIDVNSSVRHAKRSLITSFLSLVFPALAVFILCRWIPQSLIPNDVPQLNVDLFLALSTAVVAIPVVAKILFDLQILRSYVGLSIITAGVMSDIWGWTFLTIIISTIEAGGIAVGGVMRPVLAMLLYFGVAMTAGRWIVDHILNILKVQADQPTAMLAVVFALALLNGAIAHLMGLHVILGAFVAGLMAGESERISTYVRQSIQDFIFGVFAPIFFVLIGMQMDFSNRLPWGFVLLVLAVASLFKILGGYLGGLMAGMGRKNARAMACGLNTQGSMGIIIALIGRDMGILNQTAFSVIVFVCIITSLLVGPLLQWAIKGVRRPLAKYFDSQHVFLDLHVPGKTEAIKEIAHMMQRRGLIGDAQAISRAIISREEEMSTAIGEGVALPHARIANLSQPILCFFRLLEPIEYGSPDNKPVQLLFLELTDSNDDGMQLNLIAQVARIIANPANRRRLLNCKKDSEVPQILSLDENI